MYIGDLLGYDLPNRKTLNDMHDLVLWNIDPPSLASDHLYQIG